MLQMYAAIWRTSGRSQIVLILLSISIASLAAVPLSFQKDIINGLTDTDIDKSRLLELCAGMMAMILLSLALKWLLGFRSGVLGEDVTRRLRRVIYTRTMDGTTHSTHSGTLSTIISAEAEELGRFTGGAFSDPVVQVGTLISVVGFIASTQPGLGLIALGMILPQVVLVLATQPKVNELVAHRVRVLRGTVNQITERDLDRINDEVLAGFDEIFETRRQMFLWKLSTKFLLSTINGAGTVIVLLLGGALVLDGKTDVGTVVAATAGLNRLQGPSTFMIAFYRQVSATRVKYELLREVIDTEQPQGATG